jgi:hypothetical protein
MHHNFDSLIFKDWAEILQFNLNPSPYKARPLSMIMKNLNLLYTLEDISVFFCQITTFRMIDITL